jgi:hypothetical protein
LKSRGEAASAVLFSLVSGATTASAIGGVRGFANLPESILGLLSGSGAGVPSVASLSVDVGAGDDAGLVDVESLPGAAFEFCMSKVARDGAASCSSVVSTRGPSIFARSLAIE